MTKNDKREFDIARRLVAHGRLDTAARTIATVYRCARSDSTRGAAIQLVYELELKDRVTFVQSPFGGGYGMVHVDDAVAIKILTGESV